MREIMCREGEKVTQRQGDRDREKRRENREKKKREKKRKDGRTEELLVCPCQIRKLSPTGFLSSSLQPGCDVLPVSL